MVKVVEAQVKYEGRGDQRTYSAPGHDVRDYTGDSRWPQKCEHCDYVFTHKDTFQVFTDLIYVRIDTGAEIYNREMQRRPGAMFDAWWYPWKGPDGKSIVAVCPDGHPWSIDGRARNCTLPDDDVHRCWLRTGEPPRLTVSKSGPGTTCGAGAGSIATSGYHGFLKNGVFT